MATDRVGKMIEDRIAALAAARIKDGQAALDTLTLTAERDAALAAVERVRARHVPKGAAWCGECGHNMPCPTIRDLDGET